MTEGSELYSAVDCSAIVTLMNRKFSAWIGEKYFQASIKYESNLVNVNITLRNESGTSVYPVDGRIQTTSQDLSAQEGAELLIDFIDSYFEEYLKSGGETLLPIDWADYTMEEKNIQIRGQIVNENLEKMADDLLGDSKQAWS